MSRYAPIGPTAAQTTANEADVAVLVDPSTGVYLGSQANPLPVSAGSLPLPSGAASETTLAALNGKIPVNGPALSGASIPVVPASDWDSISERINRRNRETQTLEQADAASFSLVRWAKERVSAADRRGSYSRGSLR